MKVRVDRLLVDRGLAESPGMAMALIMAGQVYSGEEKIIKAGQTVDPGIPLQVRAGLPYVSRGGLKLAEALDKFDVKVDGRTVMDVGSSTGGFTDCLLQRGAARVYAVDVDIKQLDERVRASDRVTTIRKNARFLEPGDIPEAPSLVTMDVSFISITRIFPALAAFPGGWELVSLIKPQFEAVRGDVGEKGIVRDPSVHGSVLKAVTASAAGLGFVIRGLLQCSTHGQKGNIEFFGRWTHGEGRPVDGPSDEMIRKAVNDERD